MHYLYIHIIITQDPDNICVECRYMYSFVTQLIKNFQVSTNAYLSNNIDNSQKCRIFI